MTHAPRFKTVLIAGLLALASGTGFVAMSDPAAAQGHSYGRHGRFGGHGGFGRHDYAGRHGELYGRHGGYGYGRGHGRSFGGHGGHGGHGY
ncbi:hypothetical protein [Methylobacterium isbiliense]|jgi:hypothetical protein|uniref:hypothetical protein n=1 Tax=Methylobacterium isbiliense TaxID=315478 RepID=UPI0025B3F443|nr:hypothetical protein [Methylobacterium isbiliense]MDN3626878.1 hypothetical protein [Methylobacterium isbiliense]